MIEKEQAQFTSEERRQIEKLFLPLLQYGTIEIRKAKDGILIYQVKRKEVARINCF